MPNLMTIAADQQQLLITVPCSAQRAGGRVGREIHALRVCCRNMERDRVGPQRGDLGEVQSSVQEGHSTGEDNLIGGHVPPIGLDSCLSVYRDLPDADALDQQATS